MPEKWTDIVDARSQDPDVLRRELVPGDGGGIREETDDEFRSRILERHTMNIKPPKASLGDRLQCRVPNMGPWTVPVTRVEGSKVFVTFTYSSGPVEFLVKPATREDPRTFELEESSDHGS
jgi:hypothetical protein